MSQEVKVKEVRGPLGKGEKKFFAVVADDGKGTEFTTFDSKVKTIPPGSTIGIDIKVEGKYVNIIEWKMISEAPAPASSAATGKADVGYKRDTEGIRFEYELKVWMQNIDRVSIEAQTAYNRIMEQALQLKDDKEFKVLFKKALQWAEGKLDASMKQPALEAKPTPKVEPKKTVTRASTTVNGKQVDPEHPFPHIGALLSWCATKGIDKAQALEIWNVKDADLPKLDIAIAHQLILDYLVAHPADPNDPEGLFGGQKVA